MNSFDAYRTYLALKQHFSSDYDYFKYQGKVNATISSFQARRDRFFFDKLAKHNDPVGFLLSNIIHNPTAYIRELAYGENEKTIYKKWLKTKESLSYIFTTELAALDPDFNSNFVCKSNDHPPLLKTYLRGKISIETLCILCDLTGCLKHWGKQLEEDIVYKDVGLLVRKYSPFLQFDKEKFKKIIRSKMKET